MRKVLKSTLGFLVVFGSIVALVPSFEFQQAHAATPVMTVQGADGSCNNSFSPEYTFGLDEVSHWVSDGDSFEPNCFRLKLEGDWSTVSRDFRLGIRRGDRAAAGSCVNTNTAANIGTWQYTPWVSESSNGVFSPWALVGRIGEDPDCIQFALETRNFPSPLPPGVELDLANLQIGFQMSEKGNSLPCGQDHFGPVVKAGQNQGYSPWGYAVTEDGDKFLSDTPDCARVYILGARLNPPPVDNGRLNIDQIQNENATANADANPATASISVIGHGIGGFDTQPCNSDGSEILNDNSWTDFFIRRAHALGGFSKTPTTMSFVGYKIDNGATQNGSVTWTLIPGSDRLCTGGFFSNNRYNLRIDNINITSLVAGGPSHSIQILAQDDTTGEVFSASSPFYVKALDPNFALTCSIPSGQNSNIRSSGFFDVDIRAVSVDGFNSSVTASHAVTPAGPTASYTPSATFSMASGSGSTRARINAAGSTAGAYSVTFTVTGGGKTVTCAVPFTVQAVNYTLTFTDPTKTVIAPKPSAPAYTGTHSLYLDCNGDNSQLRNLGIPTLYSDGTPQTGVTFYYMNGPTRSSTTSVSCGAAVTLYFDVVANAAPLDDPDVYNPRIYSVSGQMFSSTGTSLGSIVSDNANMALYKALVMNMNADQTTISSGSSTTTRWTSAGAKGGACTYYVVNYQTGVTSATDIVNPNGTKSTGQLINSTSSNHRYGYLVQCKNALDVMENSNIVDVTVQPQAYGSIRVDYQVDNVTQSTPVPGVNFTLTTTGHVVNRSGVPQTFSQAMGGSPYSLIYQSGAPAGKVFEAVVAPSPNIVPVGGTIRFIIKFKTPSSGGFSIPSCGIVTSNAGKINSATGGTFAVSFTTKANAGFTGQVQATLSGKPSFVTANPNPITVNVGSGGTMNFTVPAGASEVDYPMQLLFTEAGNTGVTAPPCTFILRIYKLVIVTDNLNLQIKNQVGAETSYVGVNVICTNVNGQIRGLTVTPLTPPISGANPVMQSGGSVVALPTTLDCGTSKVLHYTLSSIVPNSQLSQTPPASPSPSSFVLNGQFYDAAGTPLDVLSKNGSLSVFNPGSVTLNSDKTSVPANTSVTFTWTLSSVDRTKPCSLYVNGSQLVASINVHPTTGTPSFTISNFTSANVGAYTFACVNAFGETVTSPALNISLQASQSFTLTCVDSSLVAEVNTSKAMQVQVTPQGGFTGRVSVSVQGLPSGVTSDSPKIANVSSGPVSVFITLSMGNSTPGTYSLTIQGDDVNTTAASKTCTTTLRIAPPAPATLTATPGACVVQLSWPAVTAVDSYKIYRGATADFTNRDTSYGVVVSAPSTSYVVSDTTGTFYYYFITSMKNGSESITPTRTATSVASNSCASSVPFGLSYATPQCTAAGNPRIQIDYDAIALPAGSNYRIYRGLSAASMAILTTTNLPSGHGVYIDETGSINTTYYYAVTKFSGVTETTRVPASFTTNSACTPVGNLGKSDKLIVQLNNMPKEDISSVICQNNRSQRIVASSGQLYQNDTLLYEIHICNSGNATISPTNAKPIVVSDRLVDMEIDDASDLCAYVTAPNYCPDGTYTVTTDADNKGFRVVFTSGGLPGINVYPPSGGVWTLAFKVKIAGTNNKMQNKACLAYSANAKNECADGLLTVPEDSFHVNLSSAIYPYVSSQRTPDKNETTPK